MRAINDCVKFGCSPARIQSERGAEIRREKIWRACAVNVENI